MGVIEVGADTCVKPVKSNPVSSKVWMRTRCSWFRFGSLSGELSIINFPLKYCNLTFHLFYSHIIRLPISTLLSQITSCCTKGDNLAEVPCRIMATNGGKMLDYDEQMLLTLASLL